MRVTPPHPALSPAKPGERGKNWMSTREMGEGRERSFAFASRRLYAVVGDSSIRNGRLDYAHRVETRGRTFVDRRLPPDRARPAERRAAGNEIQRRPRGRARRVLPLLGDQCDRTERSLRRGQ